MYKGLFPSSNTLCRNISQAMLLPENPEGLTSFHFSEDNISQSEVLGSSAILPFRIKKVHVYVHMLVFKPLQQRDQDLCVCLQQRGVHSPSQHLLEVAQHPGVHKQVSFQLQFSQDMILSCWVSSLHEGPQKSSHWAGV